MATASRRRLLEPRWEAAEEAELWAIVRSEMSALLDDHDDGYYGSRLDRNVILDDYEVAVLRRFAGASGSGGEHVFEVGAGWGPLCIALAALGYRVTAFNGEAVHSSAMQRLIEASSRSFPEIGRNVEIREGFFPYALTRDDVAGRSTTLICTNIVNDVNRSSQDAILAAASHFDRVFLDVATFSHDRDVEGRAKLRALLNAAFTEEEAVWEDRLLELKPRSGTPPWAGHRPPMPDWLMAGPQMSGEPGAFGLAAVWPTLAAREDRCWILHLPDAHAGLCDTMDEPTRSPFRLTEDGTLLGPPHSLHDDIARLGAGRYSHWGHHLLFSTSDGSDPRSNGRRYDLVRSAIGDPILG